MSTKIAGLSGEAALTAMDIGHAVRRVANGTDRLMEAVRATVLPHGRAKAKQLYKVGHTYVARCRVSVEEPSMVETAERSR